MKLPGNVKNGQLTEDENIGDKRGEGRKYIKKRKGRSLTKGQEKVPLALQSVLRIFVEPKEVYLTKLSNILPTFTGQKGFFVDTERTLIQTHLPKTKSKNWKQNF